MKFCMKIVVVDGYSIKPGDLSWDALEALGSLEIYGRTSEGEFFERAAGANVLLIAKVPITAEALDHLPELRYLGVIATGYNMVDVEAVRARGIVCDLTDEGQATGMCASVLDEFGRVDVLVNGLGHAVAPGGDFEATTPELWDEVYRTNLRHVFTTTHAFLPGMRSRQWGRGRA